MHASNNCYHKRHNRANQKCSWSRWRFDSLDGTAFARSLVLLHFFAGTSTKHASKQTSWVPQGFIGQPLRLTIPSLHRLFLLLHFHRPSVPPFWNRRGMHLTVTRAHKTRNCSCRQENKPWWLLPRWPWIPSFGAKLNLCGIHPITTRRAGPCLVVESISFLPRDMPLSRLVFLFVRWTVVAAGQEQGMRGWEIPAIYSTVQYSAVQYSTVL